MPVDDFPDGFFYLVSQYKKNHVIEARGESMKESTDVIAYAKKPEDQGMNQRWLHLDGFLINVRSGLVMDIYSGKIESDKHIIQYLRKPGPAENQRWKYKDGFIFPAASPYLVLDLQQVDKTFERIVLKEKHPESKTQQWTIEPFENKLSNVQLALLRPTEYDTSNDYPGPNEIYDCYRRVCLEKGTPTLQDISGAAAFQALKRIVLEMSSEPSESFSDEAKRKETQETLKRFVSEEAARLLDLYPLTDNKKELLEKSTQVAVQYYDREYCRASAN